MIFPTQSWLKWHRAFLKLPLNYFSFSAPSGEGGGSGGRIAILLSTPFRYRGVVTAVGGASTKYPGGPGSVYIELTVGDALYRVLQVDSRNRATSLEITEGNGLLYHFHELRLFKKGAVSIKRVSCRSFS